MTQLTTSSLIEIQVSYAGNCHCSLEPQPQAEIRGSLLTFHTPRFLFSFELNP